MKRLFWLILSLLSFFICGFMYLDSHSAEVNLAKADYYYKKNDSASAIKYYEQAFEGGINNQKARYNYVELLINSALDANAQEKLIKFIESKQENDAAQYKVNNFFNELRYEIHRKYSDNYILQSTYNGKIIRWTSNPITYGYINQEQAPEYFINEIDKAFYSWEKALDGIIKFEKIENNPKIIIKFNDENIPAENNEKYIVALTKPVLNKNTLINMITEYHIKQPDGNYFSENQVYNTALHEIGHNLGFMGHSDNSRNIMNMSTDSKTVNNDLRKTLTTSDINTMELLYKIKPDITDTKHNSGEYTKYLILGNNTEVANAKIREAKNYINKAPNLPSGYVDLADAYVSMQEYSKAVKYLQKALTLAKDNETICMIYYNLALTNYFKANYDEALSYLEKSGKIKDTETGKHLLAEIYTESGLKSEAITIYENLIQQYPSNIDYVIALTNIFIREKKYISARNVLKIFVSKNPNEKNNPRFAPYGIIRLFL